MSIYGSTLLNTKLSVAISILSGLGFVAVLSLTPTTPPSKRKYIHEKEILPLKKFDKKAMVKLETEKNLEDKSFLSVKPVIENDTEFLKSNSGSGFPNSSTESLLPFYNNHLPVDAHTPDIFTYYKDENISVNTIGDRRAITNQILEYKFHNRMVEHPNLFQSGSNQIRNLEMNYQINSNFSANFRSTQFDLFDDRLKQYPTTMAGLSYTGNKYISTGFIAGESTLNNPYRYNQVGGILNGYHFHREMDAPIRDADRINKNLFEWQANITPTKNLLFQTAIYNSNRSIINETNVSEGARLAMAVKLKYFVLNLKYNYLSDNLMRTVLKPDSLSMFNKDYAAFGFTFFLDKFRRYSVYIGNNYYNITTLNHPTESSNKIPVNNSISASLRGKSSDYYNTTFFLNFKNNANRDYYYSNFGVFRLPVYSQVNSEYATSLGLELYF